MASVPPSEANSLPSPALATSATTPLDHQKLAALPTEQQDLYLLSYLSDLEKTVIAFDADGATAYQFFVKRELIKIIALQQPAPTKVTREIIGRCLADIFEKGDRKLLFECINELVGLLGSGKGDKDLKTKQ